MFLTQICFWPKKFFGAKKVFRPKNFFDPKSFLTKKVFVDQKSPLTKKVFWPKKFVWPKKFFFTPNRICLTQKKFVRQNFFDIVRWWPVSRGLKFCMQSQLSILTTTQHNFKPTIFWGGGGHQPPPLPPRINPTHFFLWQKYFRTTNNNPTQYQPYNFLGGLTLPNFFSDYEQQPNTISSLLFSGGGRGSSTPPPGLTIPNFFGQKIFSDNKTTTNKILTLQSYNLL